MRLLRILVVVLVAVGATVATSTGIKIVENGYEGLVVAISPTLGEDIAEDIIASVKTAITEASEVLFKATQQKLFFRKVKILLPKSWSNTSIDEPALNEHYEDSEIHVAERNVVYGDQPYTIQPGGCGDPGQYIHITPQYLTDDTQAGWWGPRGKVLTHEWAKLRWGIFEEFGYPGDTRYPLFYWQIASNGEVSIKPNYCADHELNGQLIDINSRGSCTWTSSGPDENCRFVPSDDQDVSTSMMSYYYINSVEEFCDSRINENSTHNIFAPNRQNTLCNGRSVWEVISEHPDFSADTSVAVNTSVVPEFKVVREVEANFVLVMDYSGSMAGDRVANLQKSAQRWLLHEVADGSFVAAVRFESAATVLANLTQISNSSREILASLITTDADGATCIGCGLRTAVQILKDQYNGVILLITDGDETTNISPVIDEVMEEVVASGARVVTIAYSEDADTKLEALALNTGGKSYFVADNDIDGMNNAFTGSLTYQPGDSLVNIDIQIHESIYLGPETQFNETFDVDFSVGRNLKFRLDTNLLSHVTEDPYLVTPSGSLVNTSVFETITGLWSIDIEEAENGTWTWFVGLSGAESNFVRVSVTAQARDPKVMPIYSEAWMSSGLSKVNATAERVVIYARVTQGNNPVVGAKVRAYVTRPETTEAALEMDLLDNGVGADTQKGDGVYSSYFTQFSAVGRYSVKAQVWDDGSSYINNGFITSRKSPDLSPLGQLRASFSGRHPRAINTDPLDETHSYCCGSAVPFDSSTATPTGNFRRTAVGGSFQVSVVPPEGDSLPPSRVVDLQVTENSQDNITLSWTAPGDDLDTGMVSGYEIRISKNHSDLQEATFDLATDDSFLLTLEESQNTSEVLVEGGREISLNVAFELEQDILHFVALRAWDKVNHKSLVSNMAPVILSTYQPPSEETEFPGWGIMLILFAVGIVVLGLIAFTYKKRYLQLH